MEMLRELEETDRNDIERVLSFPVMAVIDFSGNSEVATGLLGQRCVRVC
jgi:hypothetical protein